mgnify:CR=1 FL=1
MFVSVDLPMEDPTQDVLSFNSLTVATHQMEILFVVCTLLGGKKKMDVQRRLVGIGLVEKLTLLFDKIDWNISKNSKPERIHGPK